MSQGDAIYETAASGDEQAYQWLRAYHHWVHMIDDHIDEAGPRAQVVDIGALACVLFSAPFYQRHVAALGPLIAVVAAQYKQSLASLNPRVVDALRVAGNQVVLAVAYITGGLPAVEQTAPALWKWVEECQFRE